MGSRIGTPVGLGMPPLFLGREFVQRQPGPLGLSRSLPDKLTLDFGRPGPNGLYREVAGPPFGGFTDFEVENAQGDLELLGRLFGNFKEQNNKYIYVMRGSKRYQVERYLQDRIWHFGPGASYQVALATARGQLDANGERLRNYVDPPKEHNPAKHIISPRHTYPNDWRAAQDVFYTWVLRSYEKQGMSINEVPDLIMSGLSKGMRAVLDKVRAKYGPSRYAKLRIGKANPRPKKDQGSKKTPAGYRLQTLSDHAFGNAVDINAEQNPQISSDDWDQILAFTGKSLNQATRHLKWDKDPKGLYDAIQDINDTFVANLEAATKKVREDAKTKAGTDPVKLKAANALTDGAVLEAAINANAHLKKLGDKWIKKFQMGFFNHPWELVKALRDEDCVWGAVFSTVDLHHFQLPDALAPALPGRVNLLWIPRAPADPRET